MQMLTFSRKGATEGIDMMAASQFFMAMAEAQPGATVSDVSSFIHIPDPALVKSLSVTPGDPRLLVLSDADPFDYDNDDDSEPANPSSPVLQRLSDCPTLPTTPFLLEIPTGSVLRLTAIDPTLSAALQITPSGELIRLDRLDEPPRGPQRDPAGNPQVQAALDWLFRGEIGSSALAIVDNLVLSGTEFSPERPSVSHPRDGADIRRCALMLDAVPGLRERLSEMASVSSEWAALVSDDVARQAFRALSTSPKPR